ncbi:ribosome biogenesis protein BOP1 homolog [Striga asiatica]|uniref:Ribosome biogenesis protein BOP1 homolog n=1 Tax=Striga asiatica TaxID=4170 RepID=A0A5A7Q922_STRAF|nr:ribosome biogenesis protein BOP1 homolog [Striga asiatica]
MSAHIQRPKMGTRQPKQNSSDKPKLKDKGKKILETLKEKNIEENLRRIKEAETEDESSDDSPFDSGPEEDEDEDESLSEEGDSSSESGSEQSNFSEDEDNFQSGDDDEAGDASDDVDHSRGDVHTGDGNESKSDDSRDVVEESDSSEDEVAPRNTVGNVPLEWYKDEEHIGYDLAGKKIKKKERQSMLDFHLARADDSKSWRKIYDEYNDEEVELTKEETKMISRVLKGKAPHADFDPYAPFVDWFVWDGAGQPLSGAPEPKRRFIPSKWESKKVVRYIRAIREGRIKLDDKPKEEPKLYSLWDDSSSVERQGLAYIAAPKPKLPGHEESYNPSPEYIPTQEEINSYQLMFEEDRPKFIPKQFTSLRSVPAYEKAVQETFDRCLDLYLCPRVRKKRINIDPESLKPKLPSRRDLKPYPTTCYLEYKGHKGPVTTITTEPTGQWIASGSKDGTVRIWEVETGRCLQTWDLGENIEQVAWNPLPELPILAVAAYEICETFISFIYWIFVEYHYSPSPTKICRGQDVFILNTGCGADEQEKRIEDLLRVGAQQSVEESGISTSVVEWGRDDRHGGIRLKHFKTVTKVEWHRKGDYLSTLMPSDILRLTQRIPFKTKGIPVSTAFHPSRSIFFTASKKDVRVYDLLKQKLIKKLDAGVREISSIAIHPGGDNAIVGSKDGKLCWFDMDLSSRPYRVLRCHPKDITGVAYHRSYPLFASCSDDCTAYVFHGMVYSDLNQNPLIVPLEILRGHSSADGRGVLDLKFHPRQPWLFTAGADSLIKLYCH